MNIKQHSQAFSCCEQITPDNVAWIASLGFNLLINNRPDNEVDGQPSSYAIAQAAKAAGIHYQYIPIKHTLLEEDIQQLSEQINGHNGPTLAFCRTGTRSTNLWLMTLQGEKQSQAIEHAKALGYDLALVNNSLKL